MKQYFLAFLLVYLTSCGQDNSNGTQKKNLLENADNNKQLDSLKHFDCKSSGDTIFKKMKCGLYKDKNGDIGFRDFVKSSVEEGWCGHIYITKAYTDESGDKGVELKKIIDTNTLIVLNDLYFKDKNKVYYYFHRMEDGQIYEVSEADVKTFKTFKDTLYRMGFDKNNFFETYKKLSKKEIKNYNLKRPS